MEDIDITDMSIIAEDKQQYLLWFIVAVVAGIAGVFLFSLVQNMSAEIAIFDFWTITHTVIMAAQLTAIGLVMKMIKNERRSSHEE